MRSIVRLSRCCLAAVLALLLPGCVFVTGTLNPFTSVPQPLEEHVVSGESGDKILLVDISRVIGDQEDEGAFGIVHREGTVARVREELQRAAKDDDVRAVVLRINSPGGTVTASDIVFQQVMDFKAARGVPVVAQLLDMATSGAYYVALAADEIVASPTTVTGSVGVVLYSINLSGLMEKLGITDQTVKSGDKKDIGSPLRKMRPDEEAILHTVLAELQERFLTVVRERRRELTPETVRLISDGRILTADQALQARLVDRIGYLQDAVHSAERRANLTQSRVIMYRRPEEFAENIYSRAAPPAPQMNFVNFDFGGLAQTSPQFLYMWLPSH